MDARSDIFSLGVMLYEMVSGARAFDGDSRVSALGAILHKDPAPLGIEGPSGLKRLSARCLRKDPERRVQSMKDVKVELQELKDESDSGYARSCDVDGRASTGCSLGPGRGLRGRSSRGRGRRAIHRSMRLTRHRC